MASCKEHCRDTERLFGMSFKEIHRYMDQYFYKKAANHRRILHHKNGVLKVLNEFGTMAAKAAIAHIVRDCGAVPERDDYETGRVNTLGMNIVVGEDGICRAPKFLYVQYQHELEEYEKVVSGECKRILGAHN